MLNISQMKADAEEGLRIAEKATPNWKDEAGFNNTGCPTRFLFVPGHNLDAKVEMLEDDSIWVVDSRTRAPDAYRNVIALVEENEGLRNRIAQLEGHQEPDALIVRATEALAYHERGGEYAGGDIDALANVTDDLVQALGVARGEIETLRAQLDKHAIVKP